MAFVGRGTGVGSENWKNANVGLRHASSPQSPHFLLLNGKTAESLLRGITEVSRIRALCKLQANVAANSKVCVLCLLIHSFIHLLILLMVGGRKRFLTAELGMILGNFFLSSSHFPCECVHLHSLGRTHTRYVKT